MIRLEDVTLSAGTTELLTHASWHLRPTDKVGLVGRNGSGKTTLLRAILGEAPLDGGRIHLRADARVGYLPQQAVSGSSRPLWDEASSRMDRINALKAQLDAAQAAADRGDPGADARLADATETFRMEGGFSIDERIGEVLHGLGFRKEDWRRSCAEFSGGWQMRIALARLLLSEPNVLLLDEPTNHLDLHARSWLATFLARYPHAVVVVSHDRHLLDRACNTIVELSGRDLERYAGNWTAWRKERALRAAQQASAYEAQQAEIARLERFVDRFKAKATKASQAQSRQKVLDKMERLDAPERESRPRYLLPAAPPGSVEALGLRAATLGWDAPVLSGVELHLERGMRVAVLGPNGGGKSTLLHGLSGRLPLLAGRRVVGSDLRLGVFTQDLAQDLPPDRTGLEHVLDAAPGALPERARAALGALGLSGDKALRPIGELSGGEKARVALAVFAVRACNALLLDEPTNHLDAVTVEVLADALEAFEGALLLVSHDRWLVEQVATHVILVRDGAIALHEGVRPEDFEPIGPGSTSEGPSGRSDDHAARKRRQREAGRTRQRIEAIGVEIEKLDAEIARLEDTLFEVGDDWGKGQAIAADQEAARQRQGALWAEWERLEAELAADPG